MNLHSKICVIGHKGMLGHAIVTKLKEKGYCNIIGCDLPEVDLCNQVETRNFFCNEKPEIVFFLAAVAAGIEYKKKYPADMLMKNAQIIVNVFESCYSCGCKNIINVCSALLYPKNALIPLNEDSVNSSDLNTIDSSYSLAKALGMQLARNYNCQYSTNYITVVPCNFFGEYAPFEGDKAGVVPSLINRMYKAKANGEKTVSIWGTGNACREVLNSKDVAEACVFLAENTPKYDLINIGRGEEYSIKQIAEVIKKVVGYDGELEFDSSKPEGRMHMQLNTSRIFEMGWRPKLDLINSIQDAYNWYIGNISK